MEKIPTCIHPIEPNSIYIRIMYKEFFYGPFKNEDEVINFLKLMDEKSPYWDYDCFSIHYGANPLPKDYVFGFPNLPEELESRIRKRK